MPVDLQLAGELAAVPGLDAGALGGIAQAAMHQIANCLDDSFLERELCIRVCAAQESHSLNARYRGKDKPTNVLSFAAPALPQVLTEISPPLGDLAICWPVVVEEARDQGKSVEDHFTHLLVHGVLHLLGYDHETDEQAAEMEALEVRVLALLLIADPYQ